MSATAIPDRRVAWFKAPMLAVGLLLTAAPNAGAQLTVTPVSRPIGQFPGDNFGWSVWRLGDANGDGADDWLVGAPNAPGRSGQGGRAYVFLGGAHLDSIPDVIMLGRTAAGHLGKSIAGVGDVNRDGYDDWLVGNPDYDTGSGVRFAGRAQLYFGGASLNDVADLTLDPPATLFSFGSCVAGLGDVNGDGAPDFAVLGVGASPETSTVSVYLGGPTVDSNPDVMLHFGGLYKPTTVAGAGDVNGDGWNDIVVSGTSNSSGAASRIAIYFGGPALDGVPDLVLTSPVLGDLYGYTVAGVGDVNGDGYADLLVGAPLGSPPGHPSAGQALLYFGGPSIHGLPDRIYAGQGSYDNFGIAVAAAGDLDGDGYADVLVGASRNDSHGNDAGRAYVYFGGPDADTLADAVVDGENVTDNLGFSLSGAGSPDAVGGDEILVGAVQNDAGGTNSGRVYLVHVSRFGVISPGPSDHWNAGEPVTVRWSGSDTADLDLTLDGGATWTTIATGVGGGPLNEATVTAPEVVSGRAQLRVRVSGADPRGGTTTRSTGFFHIVRPAPATPATASAIASVTARDALHLGGALALGVDWDGDGRPDVIAGDPDPGNGFLHVSHETPGDTAHFEREGDSPAEQFGASLADVGDLDGDGWDDLAVGAPANRERGFENGKVYVFRGGPASDGRPDFVFYGVRRGELFGNSVAAAGDVNGDGRPDLVVGAPGSISPGHVYVFFGGASIDTVAGVTLDAGLPGPFGTVVSGAGDVNGDGYADMLASGAPLPGGNGATTVHLLFGSPVSGVFDRTVIEGERVGDRFGASLAPAGDLDGDGFADFAVGVPLAPGVGADAGRVNVYFGGPRFAPIAGLVLRGRTSGEQLGGSLAGGVDLNGDGRADLVIGSPAATEGGRDAGRVSVLFGGADALVDLELAGEPASQFGSALSVRAAPGDTCFGVLAVGSPLGLGPASANGRVDAFRIGRWRLESPPAGTRWLTGSRQVVRWHGAAPADVWLESDAVEFLLGADQGGVPDDSLEFQVAADLPDSAWIELRPAESSVRGIARSDVAVFVDRIARLRHFEWSAEGEGVALAWATEPPSGPSGVAGYRVRRLARGESGEGTAIGPALLAEPLLVDPAGRPGDTYVLFAVDGLGHAAEVGRLVLPAPPAGIRAWPQPGGEDGHIHLAFAAPLLAGGAIATDAEVEVFDVRGRLVVTLLRGRPPVRAGIVNLDWFGHDERGRAAGSGVYFVRLRSASAGVLEKRRVVLLDSPVR